MAAGCVLVQEPNNKEDGGKGKDDANSATRNTWPGGEASCALGESIRTVDSVQGQIWQLASVGLSKRPRASLPRCSSRAEL